MPKSAYFPHAHVLLGLIWSSEATWTPNSNVKKQRGRSKWWTSVIYIESGDGIWDVGDLTLEFVRTCESLTQLPNLDLL